MILNITLCHSKVFTYDQFILISFKDLIERHYADANIKVESYIRSLREQKLEADEVAIFIIAKMFRRNISVLTAHKSWNFYQSISADIVIAYNGKNWEATATNVNGTYP